ncbi:DivIVA domain [Actinoalloteichus sp. GBA129-24]|nr:DivIVA domain [Actinoalloteichus sp. GBA129-24]
MPRSVAVTTLLIYLAVMLLVAAVVFLLVSVVFGSGEELAPLPPGVTPTTLPETSLAGADVRALRFQQAVRGYRMTEVDWALEKVAVEVDVLRTRVAELERELAEHRSDSTARAAGVAREETDLETGSGRGANSGAVHGLPAGAAGAVAPAEPDAWAGSAEEAEACTERDRGASADHGVGPHLDAEPAAGTEPPPAPACDEGPRRDEERRSGS